MLGKLKNAREIAIDLEHHSFRTYSGFVCLMQISTREEDWVVDTLELREEMEELNEVFTDPNIIKVRAWHTRLAENKTDQSFLRFSTELRVTSFGYNKISICIS